MGRKTHMAVGMAILGVMIGAGAAQAATTYPVSPASPVWVKADAATLALQSPPGDYIGEGKTYSEQAPTDTFVSQSDDNMVTIGVTAADGNFWTLEFAAPLGKELNVGTTYSGAVDVLSRSGSQPGISISGDSRGCGSDTGSFTVTELALGPFGYVQNFHATFSQSCEGVNPPLTGAVSVDDAQSPTVARILFVQSATGHLGSTGNATIHGTSKCLDTGIVAIAGTLTQASTGAQGSYSLQVPCSGFLASTKWSAVVKPAGIPFAAGNASEQATWSATDQNYQIPLTKSRTVAVTL